MGQITTPIIPVSWGELLDKISILRIKSSKMTGSQKQNVDNELAALEEKASVLSQHKEIAAYCWNLEAVNEKLWDIEDAIRKQESNKDFGEKFVNLARSIYTLNDKRAEIKKQVNTFLNSEFVEEKLHAKDEK